MTDPEKIVPPATGSIPSWLINLMGFGLLIALVLAAFFYQMHGINQGLQKNALERSRMVAAIIEENLAGATLALTTIDQVVFTFLRDKVEFIAYLDEIDPLQTEELTALARETGLLGITLTRSDNSQVSGPTGWFTQPVRCSDGDGSIRYQENRVLYLQDFSRDGGDLSCVLTGLDATAIVHLRKKSSLPALLVSLSSLPGIHSVDLRNTPVPGTASSVQLITGQGRPVAQSSFPTSLGTLIVNLDAHQFLKRRDRLRQQFFLFAALLLSIGLFFSWLLYRFQQSNLQQVRTFEQIIAREHEDAALGRTTATIAHEIRNPLNAINMGLQRLRLESKNLNKSQEELLAAMGVAVNRTAAIISELQRFTRPLQPSIDTVHFIQHLHQLLTLYGSQIKEQHIAIDLDDPTELTLDGDQNLLNELLENLIKNAIEAQPDGGDIHINITEKERTLLLQMENGGFQLQEDEFNRVGEPYFTTKTRGTGLGLALSRRIAKAHGGSLEIVPDYNKQRLTIILSLPIQHRE